LGKVILVMSGPGRRMYQSLEPKPEGAIFFKRSRPQETGQLSSRHCQQYGKPVAGSETYKETVLHTFGGKRPRKETLLVALA
jgi:hypothetical protein